MAGSAWRRPDVLLVVSIALVWLPRTVVTDVRALGQDQRLASVVETRGPAAAAGSNLALIRAAVRRIPRDASFHVAYAGPWAPRRLRPDLQLARQAGASWMQYMLAPRFQVPAGRAQWLVVEGGPPSAVAARPVAAWRFGSDWLVQAR